ncbi:Tn3 family transposase [Streptomyces sp. S1A(2023)]
MADNDPVEQEKAMKFNALLTNAVILHNALDIAEIVRQLLEEGWEIDRKTWRTSRRTSPNTSTGSVSTAPTNSASSPTRTTRNSTSTSPRCASRT